MRIIFIFVLAVTIVSAKCNKGSTPCVFGGYSFKVTSEFIPQVEAYSIGDTLFLYSTFSKTLQDLINTSLNIDYSNSTGIGGDLGIASLDSINNISKPAKDSFHFIDLKGRFIERNFNEDAGINFHYLETNSSYIFHGAIVCKKKGLYAISVDNLMSRGIQGKNCTNASFAMTVTNSEKNLLWYEDALNITLPQSSIDKMYCFRVE